VCKSLGEAALYEACRPVAIGSREPLERAVGVLGGGQAVRVIASPEEGVYDTKTVNLIEVPLTYAYEPGVLKTENGRIAIAYMKRSHELLQAGAISGVACAPSNKEAMKLAGSPYIGATELYAHFAGDVRTFTVVEQAGFYIFQMTTHQSLRGALDSIDADKVEKALVQAHTALRQWGIERPRLALSGLNPHSGDGGSLGREEIEILAPAIERAAARIGPVDGPVPADSLYGKGLLGVYDGVVFLFHDTANIPIKLMEMYHPSVVITGGLPFVRTTVAHGTAYDIAYKGIAGHQQMRNCILAAARIGERIAQSAEA